MRVFTLLIVALLFLAVADAKVNVKIDNLYGDLNANQYRITNLTTPISSTEAATKGYVDTHSYSIDLSAVANKTGFAMNGSIEMEGNKIIGLGSPLNGTDAATRDYVNAHSGGGSTDLSGTLNKTWSSNPNANGYKLTGLLNGSNAQDAITYSQLYAYTSGGGSANQTMPYDAAVFQEGTHTKAYNRTGVSIIDSSNHTTVAAQYATDYVNTTYGGGKVYIGPGTYTGGLVVANKRVSLTGAGSKQTIISGGGIARVIDRRNTRAYYDWGIWRTQLISNIGITNSDTGIGLDEDWVGFVSLAADELDIRDCDYGINLGHGNTVYNEIHIGSCDYAAVLGDITSGEQWCAASFFGGEWGDWGDYGLDLLGCSGVELYNVYVEGHDISEVRLRRNVTSDQRPSFTAFTCVFEDSHNSDAMINVSKNSVDNAEGIVGNVKIVNCAFTTSQNANVTAIKFGDAYSRDNVIEGCKLGNANDAKTISIVSEGGNWIRNNIQARPWIANQFIISGAGAIPPYVYGNRMNPEDFMPETGKIVGGSTTTSDLSFQTTNADGTTGADMHFLVDNNGNKEAITILNSGYVGVNTTSPGTFLEVKASSLYGDESTSGLLLSNNNIEANSGGMNGLAFAGRNYVGGYGEIGRIAAQYTANAETSKVLVLQTKIGSTWTDGLLIANGQVGIGFTRSVGGALPAASAKMEIKSTTQGFLGPRGTTTQIANIATPAEGLEMYNLTTHKKCYYSGTTWVCA